MIRALTCQQLAKTKIIFLSFSTLRKPRDADVFIKAAGKDLNAVSRELLAQYPAFQPAAAKDKTTQSELNLSSRIKDE
jgi:elongator complex protein 5